MRRPRVGRPRRRRCASAPEDVHVEVRGAGNATRQINHIITPDFPADRLEVVEVYTPSGNWSAWPPHKHDTDDMPREAILEEVYHYGFRRPEAWGVQRLYGGSVDALWAVRDGETVIVPDGYHPFVATHGDDAYYLNALAGDIRTMACSFDPALDHVREAWTADPRWRPARIPGRRHLVNLARGGDPTPVRGRHPATPHRPIRGSMNAGASKDHHPAPPSGAPGLAPRVGVPRGGRARPSPRRDRASPRPWWCLVDLLAHDGADLAAGVAEHLPLLRRSGAREPTTAPAPAAITPTAIGLACMKLSSPSSRPPGRLAARSIACPAACCALSAAEPTPTCHRRRRRAPSPRCPARRSPCRSPGVAPYDAPSAAVRTT